jgi:pimeloyl-ACP methyl ester carboxylesterase
MLESRMHVTRFVRGVLRCAVECAVECAVALAVALAVGCGGGASSPAGGNNAAGGGAGPGQGSAGGGGASATPDSGATPDAGVDRGPYSPPSGSGPYAVDTYPGVLVVPPTNLHADEYVPEGAGPFPIVFLRHGDLRSPANLVGWGQHLGSFGFVVIVPETQNAGDDHIGAADLEATVTNVLDVASNAGSPLTGKVDASRVILGGHSSGGLAATLAAASGQVPVAGLILLDTEGSTDGESAAPGIHVPAVGAFAEPDLSGALSCNEEGTGVNTAEALAGPLFAFRVKNASHCDLESNTDDVCALGCGSTDPNRTLAFETYVTAFLQLVVQCRAEAAPYVTGPIVAADTRVTVLAVRGVAGCSP